MVAAAPASSSSSSSSKRYLLVGTFNTNLIATLAFDPQEKTLEVAARNDGQAPHSWLALNTAKDRLYATSWTEPPGLACYAIARPAEGVPTVKHLNSVQTAARSGYVCVSPTTAYSAGGPTGEVFRLNAETGAFEERVLQKLDFVGEDRQKDDGSTMDFGGLRHGSHSFDLSPDGKLAYVADIGRNAVFVFRVNDDGTLTLTDKNIAPRPTDGPRHVTPHPNGRYVYSLQEHSSMVDTFKVDRERGALKHVLGLKIIPQDHSPTLYWADEVRVSPSQQYLYCSTRGLEPSTKGWVAVYPLSPSGMPSSDTPLCLWETPTSGGWANAVEPAPSAYNDGASGLEYVALTDSAEGLVMILSFDGKEIKEVARTKLAGGAGAATVVWL
ncbi:lactonase family protein [Rhodotorula paludigena]|uniref:lactonase family protein n=1 Tax=Rhodotorula paludigena TaxID=86838 RepID=UPI0031710D3E